MKIFRCKKKNKITTNRNEIQQRRGFCDYNHSNFLHKNLFRVQIITKKFLVKFIFLSDTNDVKFRNFLGSYTLLNHSQM